MVCLREDYFLISMGMRIAHRRKELHWTQAELAEKIDVSLQTISNIELGKKAIRPENLAKLCDQLNVSSDYILYGRRSTSVMNDTIEKLSALDEDAYRTVQTLIELLHSRQ